MTFQFHVQYVPGYGLMPAEDPRYSEVAGPRLAQLLLILNTMYNMIRDGTRITKRDLYYQHFTEFTNQREVNWSLPSVGCSGMTPGCDEG